MSSIYIIKVVTEREFPFCAGQLFERGKNFSSEKSAFETAPLSLKICSDKFRIKCRFFFRMEYVNFGNLLIE